MVYAPFAAAALARLATKAVNAYYRHCAAVTGPSRSVIDEMQAYGLKTPCSVISNPIDTALFHPVPAERKAALRTKFGFSGPTVVYAGRLAVEKNIDVVVRAVARLKDDIPGLTLALAGHGAARDSLEKLAHELGLGERARFLGTLDKPTLAEVYQAADVFAIASTSETQSMVLLQAMSCGLPAVGVRWRALKEYITADTGYLVEPGDDADFARKLSLIFANPALGDGMGRRAVLVAQPFSVPGIVAAWETLYASALRHRKDLHET